MYFSEKRIWRMARVYVVLVVLAYAAPAFAQANATCSDFLATEKAGGSVQSFVDTVIAAEHRMDDRDAARGCRPIIGWNPSEYPLSITGNNIRQMCRDSPGETMYGVADTTYRMSRAVGGINGNGCQY